MRKKKNTGRSKQEWQAFSETRLDRILAVTRAFPGLLKKVDSAKWVVEIKLAGGPEMCRLNSQYRGKNYPTDVLSFPALAPFRNQGILGDLVICLLTLKSQALAIGHSAELEMEVLLIHGVLHLLGFDHEKSRKDALMMARWESKVLMKSLGPQQARKQGAVRGLIGRNMSPQEPMAVKVKVRKSVL